MIPLKPGARIAVVATSGIHDPKRLAAGLEIAREAGLTLEVLDVERRHRYLAGDDAHRAGQLMEALASPDFDAVWMTRGGYGLTRILGRLDADRIRSKPVLGFSDGTALFAALWKLRKGPLVHAPVVHSLPITDEASRRHLFDLLAGRPVEPLSGETWVPGEAEGWLLGGNIAMLAALAGTPWQFDASGSILVLEEVGEAAYRVDRLLQQLVSSGFFRGVRGIGIGQMEDCPLPAGAEYTLQDVILDHLAPLGIPIVGGLPVGHGAANRAFPLGAQARLSGGAIRWTSA